MLIREGELAGDFDGDVNPSTLAVTESDAELPPVTDDDRHDGPALSDDHKQGGPSKSKLAENRECPCFFPKLSTEHARTLQISIKRCGRMLMRP